MLTPVTGVERLLGQRRPRASSAPEVTDVPTDRTPPRRRLMRPSSLQDHRAIHGQVELQVVRAEVMLNKLGALLAVVAGVVLPLLVPWGGWALAARLIALAAIGASYFGLIWYLLSNGYARTMPQLRWISATVEPTFVVVVLLVMADAKGAAWAISSPAFMLFPGVLALGACRMRPGLVLYSTALGGALYLLSYHMFFAPQLAGPASELPTMQAWAAWERVFWLGAAGALIAYATHRMRALALAGGTEAWRRQRLVDELGRYVSRDVAHAILRGDGEALGAERREVTVLFCDVRDFTTLCEQEDPENVVAFLNEFFGRACEIIQRHGGTVNKFLGDGLLALFGAPEEHPNHAQAAAQAAHEIVYAVDELRERGGLWAHLEVGIGLDSGAVVCGAVGASNRAEYTAIGSVVNRAARLQSLSRQAHRRIVLSKACVDRLGPRANVVSFGSVKLKGFARAVPVYAFRYS